MEQALYFSLCTSTLHLLISSYSWCLAFFLHLFLPSWPLSFPSPHPWFLSWHLPPPHTHTFEFDLFWYPCFPVNFYPSHYFLPSSVPHPLSLVPMPLSFFCLFSIPIALLSLLSLISCMHHSSCLQGNQTVGVFNTADVLDGWEDEWKRLKVGSAWARCLEERGQPTPVCFKSETWQSTAFTKLHLSLKFYIFIYFFKFIY